jgi:transcription initiation factor IIE alpha subunit
MAAADSPIVDERLADSPTRAVLVYVVLRKHGPLRPTEISELTGRSRETIRRALNELEEHLGVDFERRRDHEDLRRTIVDVV